ncbi:MAG: hypothetical protein B7Y15_14625, partial [Bacteroidetes bacterium 24-39-8]
ALYYFINDHAQLLKNQHQATKPVEIALFFKDLRRCFWQRDFKGALKWILNDKSLWRYIPFYDWKLLKRILGELGKIIFSKIGKILSFNKHSN